MRTARAPTTALSGRNISEDSLATSTAILAAPYAVLQPDSFDDPGSSVPAPKGSGSEVGEQRDKTIALDEAASTFGSLDLECVLTASFVMNSIGDLGVDGGLFIGVADDGDFPRKWRMVDDRMTQYRRRPTQCPGHGRNLDVDMGVYPISLRKIFASDFSLMHRG